MLCATNEKKQALISTDLQLRDKISALHREVVSGQPVPSDLSTTIIEWIISAQVSWDFFEGYILRRLRHHGMGDQSSSNTPPPFDLWSSEACQCWLEIGGAQFWQSIGGLA